MRENQMSTPERMGDKTSESISGLASFDHQPRTRIVFGVDTVKQVGTLAREIGARRILLVTDPGIVAAGHAGLVQKHLVEANVEIAVFDQVRENPSATCVENCLAVAKESNVDTIIGLGGGSSMDTAKGCNFLLTNGGCMKDYWGVGKAKHPMLPFIAIPTTAGTGSECQSAALIMDEQTHQKMACLDSKATARIAILDPGLTLSQPPRVTAVTGIDALAHALETAVSTKRTSLSAMFSRESFNLCSKGLAEVLTHPKDTEARGRMLLGASLAGLAIENSMLGAAHASANPLTSHFGVVHGMAVGMMLPHVVSFNATDPAARKLYISLLGYADNGATDETARIEKLINLINHLLNLAGMPSSLADCGVNKSKIPLLAGEAAKQWTATFNPRPVSQADFEKLYISAFEVRA
jgi:alcohol dehydrogenase